MSSNVTESDVVRRVIDNPPRGWHYQEYETEAPYNNYGSRGYVDLLTFHKGCYHAIEVKSESAVKQCTGPNEIIRQFKKQTSNFKDGYDPGIGDPKVLDVRHSLVFLATKHNIRHLYNYSDLYNELGGSVHLYSLEDRQTISLGPDGVNFGEPIKFPEGWEEPSNDAEIEHPDGTNVANKIRHELPKYTSLNPVFVDALDHAIKFGCEL